jgi:hypothetical protein
MSEELAKELAKDLADRLFDTITRHAPGIQPAVAWKLVAAILVAIAADKGVDLT